MVMTSYRRPPDGGWGWAVTFACFMTYAIIWGIPRGVSVLYREFQNYFQSSNSETSWIISLITGCLACGTLVGSVVTGLIGARATMMSGGIISCVGAIILSHANKLSTAYIGSAACGLGSGFAYCSGQSQIGQYFDKKRSLAFGIASIGAPAIGTLLPPLFVHLSEQYTWHGAVLIIAGIYLHLMVGGSLLRPLQVLQRSELEDDLNIVEPIQQTKQSETLHEITSNPLLIKAVENEIGSEALDALRYPRVDSTLFLETISKSTSNLHFEHFHAKSNVSETVSLPDLLSTGNQSNETKKSKSFHKQALLNKTDREKYTSLTNILPRNCGNTVTSRHVKMTGENCNSTAIVISHSTDTTNTREEKLCLNHIRNTIYPYWLLLTQWRFMLFTTAGSIDYLVRLIPTSFIVVHAHSLGVEKERGAMLLVVFAIFDSIIRPISGFLTNRLPQTKLRHGIEIFLFGCAQATMFGLNLVAPWATSFTTLAVFMAMYGITNGLNSSWCFPILTRLVCTEHLHHAIGIFHFCSGIGLLAGPPIAGFLADVTGNYRAVFFFTGSQMFVSWFFAWLLYGLTRKYGIRALKVSMQSIDKQQLQ